MAKKQTKVQKPETQGAKRSSQDFFFAAPAATTVLLAGDFTHWQRAPISMQKGADGIWHTRIELSPGTHHYRFLVDGVWQDDPECTLRIPNPYGSSNSVREVS